MSRSTVAPSKTLVHIYARISQEGDRTPDEVRKQLDIYVADAKQRAERVFGPENIEYGLIEVESDVSGATKVSDRGLGKIIDRIEADGGGCLVVPDAERFARDEIESLLATERILDGAGGRILTTDGEDSDSESFAISWGIKRVFAAAYRKKTKKGLLRRIEEAAKEGRYLACRPPIGYYLDHETGRIHPHPELAPLILEAGERYAAGVKARPIAEWLREVGGDIAVPNPKNLKRRKAGEPEFVYPLRKITENGVRFTLRNRAYVGESRAQSGKKGEVRVITNAHERIWTEELYERIQARHGSYVPRDGSLASALWLAGLVECSCGERHRAKATKIGGGKQKRPAYTVIPNRGCTASFGITGERLDTHVREVVRQALLEKEPHVAAVMEGDHRYEDALAAVEEAKEELRVWVEEISVVEVGKQAWIAGKEARESKVEAARKALKTIPAPNPKVISIHTGEPVTFEEWAENGWQREHLARFVDRVVVRPVGRGVRVPVEQRVEVWFVGAEEPARAREYTAEQIAFAETLRRSKLNSRSSRSGSGTAVAPAQRIADS